MYKKLSIFIFCILLSTPLALYLLGQRGEMLENRPARTIAPISWQTLKSGEWFAGINNYLIDKTPLRQYGIRGNAALNRYVFHESESPHVSQGHGNWLFYNVGINHPCVAPEEISRRLHRFAKAAEHLHEAYGTRVVWAIPPNKEAIYPEHLSKQSTLRAACATANRMAIRKTLNDATLAPYILGLWDEIEAHKPDGQLFLHTDSHWNHRGSALGIRAILDWLWPNLYQGGMQPTDAITIEGDLNAMLGITNAPEKETLWQTTRRGVTGGKVEEAICMRNDAARRFSYRHTSTDAPLVKEKTVIIRDSFFDTPRKRTEPHLAPAFFAQLDIGHIDHLPHEDWAQIVQCADTVIIETVERNVLQNLKEVTAVLER